MKRFLCMLLAAVMLLSLAACASRTATNDDLASLGAKSGEASDWQTQYDLGVRYLSEGKYEEAILAFNAAIEIDPKNPDAYIKLAEAYEQTGDDEAALRTLQTGAEASNDSNLGILAEKKQTELDKANEPAAPAAETPVNLTRDEQIERLSGWFPKGVGANCTEYVSYTEDSGPSAYDPGFSPDVADPANTYVLYRSVTIDGPNGPECYALYGHYENYAARVWQWVLYYGVFAENGVVVTGELALPTMDIYNAQSEVVLYWDESRGVWCLEVCNVISSNEYDITVFALSGEPYVIETWQKDDDYSQNTDLTVLMEEMKTAGLPHVIRGTTDCTVQGDLSDILCGTSARQAIWLYHCDHFIINVTSTTTHLRREWSDRELAEQEQLVQKYAPDAIERDAAMKRYQLERRPELTREEADYCYGYDEGPCGGFAIVDTETGQSVATVCTTFRDEDEKSCTYGGLDPMTNVTSTVYADGCIVYGFFNSAVAPEGYGFDTACNALSFDTRTGKFYELSDKYRFYRAAGRYLVGVSGGQEGRYLALLTPRGENVAELTDKMYKVATCKIYGNAIYYTFSDDIIWIRGSVDSEVWRYDLESGERVRLGMVPADFCTYICDEFAQYYDDDWGVVRTYF